MTKYKIVLVPFPFDDLSSQKVRPAICLTNPIGVHKHLVLAFITSRVPSNPLPTDMVINRNHPDFKTTGLRTSSTIQVHRLITVNTTLIRRELGQLTPTMKKELDIRLQNLFFEKNVNKTKESD
ncbi:MAG: type II toxin-antitoxin system PemK/MazF family toxin, partial [Chloroflexota bacterium]